MKTWIRLLGTLVLWCCAASGHAQDLVINKAFFEDRGQQMTLQEVQAREFTDFDGMLTQGYSDSAFWIRLQVRTPVNQPLIKIRVRPTYLDQVWLYASTPDGVWRERRGGDRQPFADSDRTANALGFWVRPTEAHTTYYLRVQTTSTTILHVEAAVAAEAAYSDAMQILSHLVYVALIAWFGIWAFQEYLQTRERLMLYCAIFQLSNILMSSAMTGYFSVFFQDHPIWIDRLTSLLIVAAVFWGIIFNRRLLSHYKPHPVYLQVMGFLGLSSLFIIVLYLLGHERWALQANATVLMLVGVVMFLTALSTKQEGGPSLWWLRLVYLLQAFNTLFSSLPYLGFLTASELALYAGLIHGLFASTVMFFVLNKRARKIRQDNAQQKEKTSLMRQQLELSTAQIVEQDRFIDMLTHEIKTPLSIALLSMGAAKLRSPHLDRAKSALGHLDEMVSRIRLSAQTEGNRMQCHSAPVQLQQLVFELIELSTSPQRLEFQSCPETLVQTDPQLLGIIIGNLIENAIKYAPNDAKVLVRIWRPEDPQQPDKPQLCLTVCNEFGPVGAPDPAHVFEKFYRSKAASRYSGTGLGLYLSQNLARLLETKIECSIQFNTVEFSICFPIPKI